MPDGPHRVMPQVTAMDGQFGTHTDNTRSAGQDAASRFRAPHDEARRAMCILNDAFVCKASARQHPRPVFYEWDGRMVRSDAGSVGRSAVGDSTRLCGAYAQVISPRMRWVSRVAGV